jgi:hypothetical protein
MFLPPRLLSFCHFVILSQPLPDLLFRQFYSDRQHTTHKKINFRHMSKHNFSQHTNSFFSFFLPPTPTTHTKNRFGEILVFFQIYHPQHTQKLDLEKYWFFFKSTTHNTQKIKHDTCRKLIII